MQNYQLQLFILYEENSRAKNKLATTEKLKKKRKVSRKHSLTRQRHGGRNNFINKKILLIKFSTFFILIVKSCIYHRLRDISGEREKIFFCQSSFWKIRSGKKPSVCAIVQVDFFQQIEGVVEEYQEQILILPPLYMICKDSPRCADLKRALSVFAY